MASPPAGSSSAGCRDSERFPTLTRDLLRRFDAMDRIGRVPAYLMSGTKVGILIADQAECRRFTFDPKWTVAQLLNSSFQWCTPASDETTTESGKWYELLPDFRPTAVVFASGSLALPGETLGAVPGYITLMRSSEVQRPQKFEESAVCSSHESEESMSLSRATVAVDMGDSEATPSLRAGSIRGKSPSPSLLEELWEETSQSRDTSQDWESTAESETAVRHEVNAGARSTDASDGRVKLKNRSLKELRREQTAAVARMLLDRWYQLASENVAP